MSRQANKPADQPGSVSTNQGGAGEGLSTQSVSCYPSRGKDQGEERRREREKDQEEEREREMEMTMERERERERELLH